MSGLLRRPLLVASALVFQTGCPHSLNAAGIPNYLQDRIDRAIEQAVFRYPDCAKDIHLGRVSVDGRHIELSVCGSVRRFDDLSPDLISGPAASPTWVDVTAATAR